MKEAMALVAAAAALLVAFLFGFITSIPPAGPIAALLIRQSAEGEHQHALRIGIGAALVECGFATLAASALWLVAAQTALLHQIGFIIAALLFPIVGMRLLLWRPQLVIGPRGNKNGGLWLGASVAALNPAPLVGWGTFIALLHSGHIAVEGPLIPLFGLAGGAGVLSWNVLLVGLLKRHLGRLPRHLMTTFVRCVGCLLLGIGLWSALSALHVVN
jgi:threonine/homoserine/homoserine lactone efflux protein